MMKRLVFLAAAVLLPACSRAEPAEVYVEFADAILYRRFEDARELAHGEAALATVDKWERIARSRKELGLSEPVQSRTYEVQSETPSGDGTEITIVAFQDRVLNMPKGPRTFRHRLTVVLSKVDGRWRVISYEDELPKEE